MTITELAMAEAQAKANVKVRKAWEKFLEKFKPGGSK